MIPSPHTPKSPEFFRILVYIHEFSGIFAASSISQWHIKTSICQQEVQVAAGRAENPNWSRQAQPMLQINNWLCGWKENKKIYYLLFVPNHTNIEPIVVFVHMYDWNILIFTTITSSFTPTSLLKIFSKIYKSLYNWN